MAQQTVARNAANAIAKQIILKKLNLIGWKFKLIIAGIILAIFLFTVLILGIISSLVGEEVESNNGIGVGVPTGTALVSAEVEQYRNLVSEELSKHGLAEYTNLVLALMMQESGGKGNDPMQASESFCGYIGCITDPVLSIQHGVSHFKSVLERANFDIKLALQSYNFGGGFIDYVMKNGGQYTKELAISFSQMMFEKYQHLGIYKCHRPEAIAANACYGDIGYVDAVFSYLPSTITVGSEIVSGDFHSPVNRELYVTSPFGWRDIGSGPEYHKGIDFRCNESNSIHSVQSGKVVFAGVMNGYGNVVNVQHTQTLFTTYAHLSKINVGVGQEVDGGSQLGMCGNTGRSTGPHLHFEVKSAMWGGHVDPAQYLGLGGTK